MSWKSLVLPVFAAAALSVGPSVARAASSAPATAAALQPMTLTDAVTYALTHSSTVTAQVANVASAQHSLALQRGVAWPLVGASLNSYLSKSANYEGSFAALGQTQ